MAGQRRERAEARDFEGQEGSRWINRRPEGDEFPTWFATVPLHPGLQAERYIGGITLISAVEEIDAIVDGPNDTKIVAKRSQIVYIPYPKVETRVLYFWDLMQAHSDEWVGGIEPVEVQRDGGTSKRAGNAGLPPGYFYLDVAHEKGVSVFLCYTAKVWVEERGVRIIEVQATKQVPLLRYPDRADENAMMKAETGGVGRALGLAGMLVVPGAGVATAEDMQEALAQEAVTGASPVSGEGASEPPPKEPPAVDESAQVAEAEGVLRTQAAEHAKRLQDDFPAVWKQVQEHSAERNWSRLADLTGPSLRGFVRLLERKLAEAEGQPTEEAPDGDAADGS